MKIKTRETPAVRDKVGGRGREGEGGGVVVREKKDFELIFKPTPHPDPDAIKITNTIIK